MIETHRRLPLVIATLLTVAGAGVPARAQDADEEEAPPAPAAPVAVMAEENFDQWVFGGRGNAATVRGKYDALLALHLENLDRLCKLTDAQKKKLLLAGRGDIKRFFDRVEDKRRVFRRVRVDQNKMNEFFREVQPLQLAVNSGPFGERSLLAKTIKTALDEPQAAKYEENLRERRLFRYHAKLDLTVATLGDSVGMTSEQRRRLATLLREETRPPKTFGAYDYYVVMVQAAKLPEAKIRPIVDDAQWRLLSQQLAQAKGLEHFLKENGVLPDAEGRDDRKTPEGE